MTTTTSARCNGQCPGGRRCSCNNTPHTLHLCSDKGCTCHQERRYGLERAIVDGRGVSACGRCRGVCGRVGGEVVRAMKHPAGVHHGRTDTPPVNEVVGVWYEPEQREVAAVWDGQQWNGRTGERLEPQPVWWYENRGRW